MSDALSTDAPSIDDVKTAEIEGILREVVRPLLERDGGGIELVSVRGSMVVVRLVAVCAGCPGSGYTTESVLLPALRTVLSEVSLTVERAPS